MSVAVCVPAHGSPEGLRRLLASIAAADRPDMRVDVIVAVDGPYADLVRAATEAGADVVQLDVNAGSYAARNRALDRLAPDVRFVLFTDTDAEVGEAWITAHVDALANAPRSGGPVRFTFSEPPRPAELVDANRNLDQAHYVNNAGFAATVNLAVRREVVDAIRFDESKRSGGDFAFGQRCQELGFGITFTEAAFVQHRARRSARVLLRKIARTARGAATLSREGHVGADRKRQRVSLQQSAKDLHVDGNAWWWLRARLIDRACTVAYFRHNPDQLVNRLKKVVAR